MCKKRNNWLMALALLLPMCVFFLGYLFNHEPGLSPTGYIQHDNVSYIAYGKQYLDSGHGSLFYSNPFNDSDLHEPVYFQPQTIFFALLMKSGIHPGAILIPFTLFCTLLCFRLLISIYDLLMPEAKHRTLCLWLFAWGGGLLAITGLLAMPFSQRVDGPFYFDPGAGWWGLNFGRALFTSCEAWYHFLFLSIIYSILKKQWVAAILISLLLSIAHPFTGIELLGIVVSWSLAERILFRNKSVPGWFIAAAILVLAFHIWYYLGYLNQFADHRSVNEQYELNWRLRFFNMLPAYCLVAMLALMHWKRKGTRSLFVTSQNRLFLWWFVVAFALANHELFMNPMQPLHFTRGYIWSSLFLLGIPALELLINYLSITRWRRLLLAALVIIFLSDNIIWLYAKCSARADTISTAYISAEEKTVLQTLKSVTNNSSLIIGKNELLPYLATVYTEAYPWISHPFTTPSVKQKEAAVSLFLEKGVSDSSWIGRDVILIFNKMDSTQMKRAETINDRASLIVETSSYLVQRATFTQ